MNPLATKMPRGWAKVPIEELFCPLEDGRTLHQGWSPQCESEPSPSVNEWGVLKTTSIQAGAFLPEYNKRLPSSLNPRPQLEVKVGDILITCAGPRVRCGVACLVRNTRELRMCLRDQRAALAEVRENVAQLQVEVRDFCKPR